MRAHKTTGFVLPSQGNYPAPGIFLKISCDATSAALGDRAVPPDKGRLIIEADVKEKTADSKLMSEYGPEVPVGWKQEMAVPLENQPTPAARLAGRPLIGPNSPFSDVPPTLCFLYPAPYYL
ncbi:MAG: hypothetical protein ACYTEQ_06975 [Planctomycetota bacterium]|jgi:hypothetical protein